MSGTLFSNINNITTYDSEEQTNITARVQRCSTGRHLTAATKILRFIQLIMFIVEDSYTIFNVKYE